MQTHTHIYIYIYIYIYNEYVYLCKYTNIFNMYNHNKIAIEKRMIKLIISAS